ncbi:MAG TPA: hypothetical protein PKL96_03610 [Bacteroidales bacterium]|nr:hypothetical protein [Bacteroidales bacterium]HPS26709.1 hypothetical protein [Bacteroidales bacterium]
MKKVKFFMIFAGLLFLANCCFAQVNNDKPQLLTDVTATISGISSGEITIKQLTDNELKIDNPGYTLVSFSLKLLVNGEMYTMPNPETNKLSGRQSFLLGQKMPGDQVTIDDIICKGADGNQYSLPSMTFKIK